MQTCTLYDKAKFDWLWNASSHKEFVNVRHQLWSCQHIDVEVSELFPCNPILERSIHCFVERHPRPLFETKLPIKYSILHHKHSKQDRERKRRHHRKELSTRRCLQITCSTWYILIFSLMNSNVSNHDVVFWRHKM